MTTTPMDRLVEATEAIEPGIQAGDFVQQPEAEKVGEDGKVLPARPGIIVTDLASAGMTRVWDTLTRESSDINNNMLSKQMLETREDGTRVFTKIKPLVGPQRGSIKCLLHADRPEFEGLKKQGLTQKGCRKATIPNEYELQQHMKFKHSREWAVITEERDRNEREEDRDLQREIFKSLSAQPAAANLVANNDTGVEHTTDVAEVVASLFKEAEQMPAAEIYQPQEHERVAEGRCQCGKAFKATAKSKADSRLKRHISHMGNQEL